LTREQRDYIRRVRDEVARATVRELSGPYSHKEEFPWEPRHGSRGTVLLPGDWMPFADLGGLGERTTRELWTYPNDRLPHQDDWAAGAVVAFERLFRLARGDLHAEEFMDSTSPGKRVRNQSRVGKSKGDYYDSLMRRAEERRQARAARDGIITVSTDTRDKGR